MFCPSCGWEAKEIKVQKQNGDAYTCNNATCEMCNIVFAVHILGTLKEVNGTVSNGSDFEEGEWQ